MYRKAPFIWIPEQAHRSLPFVELLRNGTPDRDDGVNRWVLFRRRFDVPAEPASAQIEMTVDGSYRLFVNGRGTARGPVRSSPRHLRYDRIDVTGLVTEGANQLAVLVHVYGMDTGWYERSIDHWHAVFGDGGLYFMLCADLGHDEVVLRSDASWRCLQSDAWRSDTPRAGWGQDFIEDLDGRRLPRDWTDLSFDDSQWPEAAVMREEPADADRIKGWGTVQPFPALTASELPPLSEKFIAPSEIVKMYAVDPNPDLPIDRRVFEESLRDLAQNDEPEFAVLLTNGSEGVAVSTDESDVAVLFKFDPLICGRPFLEFSAEGGEIVEIAVTETIPGEYSGSMPEQHPRPVHETYLDCAHVTRYTARSGLQTFEKYDWCAVRYLYLVIRNAPDGVVLRRLGVTGQQYPAGERGSFSCSDPLLTELWRIGRYTALQCTHDGWVDGPGRERRQWVGDGLVHFLIDAAAFGPETSAVDRQFLFHGAESQRDDGLMQMFAPGDHHRSAVLIPDFNLHWVCALQAYLMHTGDFDSVESLLPTAQRCLAWFERQLGPNRLICDLPYWHFIEWANTGRQGEALAINALFVGALKAAADIANRVGYSRLQDRYLTLAKEIGTAVNERHWNSDRGLYVDSVDPDTNAKDPRASQHGNALAILWDIAPRDRWSSLIRKITDRERLRTTAVPPIVNRSEPFDPDTHIVRTNTFYNHFLYAALARAGRFDVALTLMREHYGDMLASGTSTLWESYEPGSSICHAFSASPVYHLSTHGLGVQPIDPGFTRFRVAIQPGDLEYVEGRYPSPPGDIRVAWCRNDSAMELQLDVPDGSIAEIAIPPGYEQSDGPLELGPGQHTVKFQ